MPTITTNTKTPLVSTNNTTFKKEGTSQTYGQLVIFPSKRDNFNSNYQPAANTPKDVIVKLTPNTPNVSLVAGDIDDTERSMISIAAFSDSATKSVPISVSPRTTVINEKGQQEKVNISDVTENIESYAIVVGSAFKTPSELKVILKEAAKVDLFVSMNSKFSEEIDFNNLKQKAVRSKFVYNFFIPEECDIRTQEDQSQDPLLTNDSFNVPRYVELSWDPVNITETLIGFDNNINILQSKYKPASGIVGIDSYAFKNSYLNAQKKTNTLTIDGRNTEIIDIHGLDKAFNSIVNGTRFTNTINTVLSVVGNSMAITNIPITGPAQKK